MSEASLSWVTLRTSAIAHRLRAVATLITLLSALLAALAAALAPTPTRALIVLAAIASLVALWVRRPEQGPAAELFIDPDAQIRCRRGLTAAPAEARPNFVGSWLIVLATGRQVLCVWPDQIGTAAFRRLSVACRWGHHGPGR